MRVAAQEANFEYEVEIVSKNLLNAWPSDYQLGEFIVHVPGFKHNLDLIKRTMQDFVECSQMQERLQTLKQYLPIQKDPPVH